MKQKSKLSYFHDTLRKTEPVNDMLLFILLGPL